MAALMRSGKTVEKSLDRRAALEEPVAAGADEDEELPVTIPEAPADPLGDVAVLEELEAD